jgi:hypothetical protein
MTVSISTRGENEYERTNVSIGMLKQVQIRRPSGGGSGEEKPASQSEDDAAARAGSLATLDAEAESEDDKKAINSSSF